MGHPVHIYTYTRIQGDPKKTIHSVLQLKSVVGVQFYFFHGWFETRILSPIQLASLQIPFRNLKWLKNAETRARTHDFIPAQICPWENIPIKPKCFGGPTSQGGCLFIRKGTCFDMDIAIVYSVLCSVHSFNPIECGGLET